MEDLLGDREGPSTQRTPESSAARCRSGPRPYTIRLELAAGPRICIGNNFSLLESHLLLAILARRFRPRLRDGFVPHFVMHGTLSIEGSLPAVIETR